MSAAELLLRALDELRNNEFKRFQFFLNMRVVDGCDPIPRQRMEDQPRDGIVAVMIDQYGDDSAVKVTDVILEKMGFNNIRRTLTDGYAEERSIAPSSSSSSSSSTTSTSSSASALAPPAAPITMSAQHGSVVIAPTLTSGTVGTLNISISKP